MDPFGRPAICPRCEKTVYAAEQAIGPGRKLYHKPCLACMICSKRLDSYTLLEHDQKPYCKSCHVKNFGTRDLRSANLPYRSTSVPPRSPSPTKTFSARAVSPTTSRPRSVSPAKRQDDEDAETRDTVATDITSFTNKNYEFSVNLGRSNSSATAAMMEKVGRPLMQTATGTRYGAALGGGIQTESPVRKFGGTVPSCGRCNKSVYFAEQVKAVGKTFHKGCLRCDECNTSLDSTKLRDHEGTPLCNRCYNKLYGPAGNGYALLGKAGG